MNEDLALFQLTNTDLRYPREAYDFIRDAIAYASDSMELDLQEFESYDQGSPTIERHFSGEQLCEAIRRYAICQFGYMAKLVLSNWNVKSTSCYGDLVYNLIRIGILKESERDRREDFDGVYNFDDVFETEIEISTSAASL